ncbi:hypothetical protein WJX79_008803 [Trebouxia sp. C0005]
MMNIGMVFCDRHYWGINYPKGGVGKIAQALADGIEEQGSSIMYKVHLRKILTEGEGNKLKAIGVQLADGSVFHGQTVISNATGWDTFEYLVEQQALPKSEQLFRKRYTNNPSFISTHMGVEADVLPQGAQCLHIIVEDWQKMQDPHETLLVSVPSLLDPSVCPKGPHVSGSGGRKKNYNRKKANEVQVQDRQDTSSTVPLSLGASAAVSDNSVREKLKTYTAARNKDSAGVPVPSAYIKGLIAEGTSTAMAGLARQAVRDNDLVSAALYAEQANKHWLKHHAVVMQYSAQMRPALPPFPFPRRQPGPPLGFQ